MLQVDIDGKNEKFQTKFDLTNYISSTVKLTSGESDAVITVEFEKSLTKKIKFKASDIKFTNIRTGLLNKFNKDKKLEVKIRGLEKDIKNLTFTELVPYIDLGTLDIGKHKVEVKFENTTNVEITKNAFLEVTIEDSNKVDSNNIESTVENTEAPDKKKEEQEQ